MNAFENRVSEEAVAGILHLIAKKPNRRELPGAGDPEGDFDFWFDGGACKILTGSMEFLLQDGTIVTVAAPIPFLSVHIRFRDGRQVSIHQRAAS